MAAVSGVKDPIAEALFIYPNTTIDLYPHEVNTWQMLLDGIGRSRDAVGAVAWFAARVRADPGETATS